MPVTLDDYARVVGNEVIDQLRQLAAPLAGLSIVHVNSTRYGGGVAEILDRLVPLMQELGLKASWEVMRGTPEFYQCTKSFHNALQGRSVRIRDELLGAYERVNAENAEELRLRIRVPPLADHPCELVIETVVVVGNLLVLNGEDQRRGLA